MLEITSTTLENKIAIITGGSSGIGKSIVEELLKYKVKVINADIITPAEDAQLNNINYFFFKTDITNAEDIRQLHSLVLETVGQPDILICNAGKGIHEKLSEGDPEKWFNVINLNLMGSLRILRSFLPNLLDTKIPDIIFISSVAANNPYEYGGIYSATKAAIEMVAATLRLELKETARVTVIKAGVVDTSFFKNLESGHLDIHEIGFGSVQPAQIAEAVTFILTRNTNQVINEMIIRPLQQNF